MDFLINHFLNLMTVPLEGKLIGLYVIFAIVVCFQSDYIHYVDKNRSWSGIWSTAKLFFKIVVALAIVSFCVWLTIPRNFAFLWFPVVDTFREFSNIVLIYIFIGFVLIFTTGAIIIAYQALRYVIKILFYAPANILLVTKSVWRFCLRHIKQVTPSVTSLKQKKGWIRTLLGKW